MDKKQLYACIDGMAAEMAAMADDIFDHPELGMEEFHALDLLTGWLEREGFQVERGVGGLKTAFRAVWNHGEGGPNIGLLCEYDALEGIGHACAIICRGRQFWLRQQHSSGQNLQKTIALPFMEPRQRKV